ncbi:MAG: hypothetical protein Q9180_001338 [Flavoplaca navasiana]
MLNAQLIFKKGIPSIQRTTPESLVLFRSQETTPVSLAPPQGLKLNLLDLSGIAVNKDGHVTDITGYPIQLDQPQQKRSQRTRFTAEDAQALAIWLDRAAAQAKRKYLMPAVQNSRHTSTSWRNYWQNTFLDPPVDCSEDARILGRQCFLDQIDRNLQQPPSSIDAHTPSLDSNGARLTNPCGNSPTPSSVSTSKSSAEPPDAMVQDGSDFPATPPSVDAFQAVQSSSEKPNNSDEALIKVLGLHNKDELAVWLSQDWVVDAYEEYYHVAIHEWRVTMERFQARGELIPNPDRRSKQKFIVDTSAAALRSRNPTYTTVVARKHHWAAHDHDIRFVVRIVDEGRAPGRCWEGYGRDEHISPLCHTAYRLMCWLRAMARIVNTANSMGRWRAAKAVTWFKFLCRIRCQRLAAKGGGNTTTGSLVVPAISSASIATDKIQLSDGVSVPSPAPKSPPHETLPNEIRPGVTRPEVDIATTASYSPSSAMHPIPSCNSSSTTINPGDILMKNIEEIPPPLGSGVTTPSAECLPGLQGIVTSAIHSVTRTVREIQGDNASYLPPYNYEVPSVPPYRPLRSKRGLNQAHGVEWALEIGKSHFDTRHELLLRGMGFTMEHASTCVLVPARLTAKDMLRLMDGFSYDKCPKEVERLQISMFQHNTSWARSAAWFRGSAWPRSGADWDNFMGYADDTKPRDGSHLCHHATCVNQHHLILEEADKNLGRSRCVTVAQGLRRHGRWIPEHCMEHQPPCWMVVSTFAKYLKLLLTAPQYASLTEFECWLIHFSIIRRAKSMPPVAAPPKPPNHEYPTFESQLPLLLPGAPIILDPSTLASSQAPLSTTPPAIPTMYCRFCPSPNSSWKNPTALWSHIRDKHCLVPTRERLQEIVRVGDEWRQYLELQHLRGNHINTRQDTWKKLEQMKDQDFDWNTILAWKITYSRPKRIAEYDFLNAEEESEEESPEC